MRVAKKILFGTCMMGILSVASFADPGSVQAGPDMKYVDDMDNKLNNNDEARENELNPPGMKEEAAEEEAARDSVLFEESVFYDSEEMFTNQMTQDELDKNYK